MLKKYKILIAIIALTAAGIAIVLGIWLYGNYRNERELFIGTAERSLFNVLQNYYQNEFSESRRGLGSDSLSTNRRHKGLLSLMSTVYPNLDLSPLKYTLDTIDHRRWQNRRSRERDRKDSPDQLLPVYLLEKIDFNQPLLDTLEPRLEQALRRRGVHTGFQLTTEEIRREDFDRYVKGRNDRGDLITRPILINPENDQFLLAQFDNPWSYLLQKLGGQLLLSVLLFTTLIGSFMYLLKTIRKQNQLAILRKSFVNNMTHELKTPVATVMAAIEAIQRFVAKDDKEKMHKYLEISKGELEHLNAMIERVLQLDVDETHRIRLEKRQIDLVPLVANSIETARVGTRKPITFHFAHDLDRLLLRADESHMKNVVSNLLDNAIKYSGDSVYIVVGLEEADECIELSIADRGKGIEAEHIKYVFDMFYRVPQGHLHEVKGFGLG